MEVVTWRLGSNQTNFYLKKKVIMKGFKTFAYGAIIAILPSLLTYVGGFDWTTLGISPSMAAMIGTGVVALRTMTNTSPGSSK